VLDAAGNIYGTTTNQFSTSYGALFKLSPGPLPTSYWHFAAIHVFGGTLDGKLNGGFYANGGLSQDASGHIFGVAPYGGSRRGCDFNGCGIVFEATP
jgi:hypothetical protein